MELKKLALLGIVLAFFGVLVFAQAAPNESANTFEFVIPFSQDFIGPFLSGNSTEGVTDGSGSDSGPKVDFSVSVLSSSELASELNQSELDSSGVKLEISNPRGFDPAVSYEYDIEFSGIVYVPDASEREMFVFEQDSFDWQSISFASKSMVLPMRVSSARRWQGFFSAADGSPLFGRIPNAYNFAADARHRVELHIYRVDSAGTGRLVFSKTVFSNASEGTSVLLPPAEGALHIERLEVEILDAETEEVIEPTLDLDNQAVVAAEPTQEVAIGWNWEKAKPEWWQRVFYPKILVNDEVIFEGDHPELFPLENGFPTEVLDEVGQRMGDTLGISPKKLVNALEPGRKYTEMVWPGTLFSPRVDESGDYRVRVEIYGPDGEIKGAGGVRLRREAATARIEPESIVVEPGHVVVPEVVLNPSLDDAFKNAENAIIRVCTGIADQCKVFYAKIEEQRIQREKIKEAIDWFFAQTKNPLINPKLEIGPILSSDLVGPPVELAELTVVTRCGTFAECLAELDKQIVTGLDALPVKSIVVSDAAPQNNAVSPAYSITSDPSIGTPDLIRRTFCPPNGGACYSVLVPRDKNPLIVKAT